MAIVPFTFVPKNLREWSTWLQIAKVTPDEGTVTHEMMVGSDALSVVGRSENSHGVVADIAAGSNGQYLGRRADVLGFYALQETDIPSEIARDTEVTAAIDAALTDDTFTGTLTGCTTSPTGSLYYSLAGTVVTLYIPQIGATSNATTATVTGAPAAIFPARVQRVPCIVKENGTVQMGLCEVGTDGVLTLYSTVAAAAFTNSGAKGIELQTITYSLA